MPTATDAEGNAETRTFDGVTLIVDHNFGWGSLTSTSAWHDYDSLNRVEEDGTNLQLPVRRLDQHREQRELLPGVQVQRQHRPHRLGRRRQLLPGRRRPDQRGQRADRLGRHHRQQPRPGAPGGLFGPITQVANMFGIPVDLTRPAVEREVRQHARHQGLRRVRRRDLARQRQAQPDRRPALHPRREGLHLVQRSAQRAGAGRRSSTCSMRSASSTRSACRKDMFIFDVAFIDPPAMMNKGVQTRAKKSWDDWSPRFVVDYHFTDDLMGFASLAKGYKAGGYNALQIGSEFENEDVWNFETGIKQSFPDQRLAYNVSGFYYVYDNRQAVTPGHDHGHPAVRDQHRPTRKPTASTSTCAGRPPTGSASTSTPNTSIRPTRPTSTRRASTWPASRPARRTGPSPPAPTTSGTWAMPATCAASLRHSYRRRMPSQRRVRQPAGLRHRRRRHRHRRGAEPHRRAPGLDLGQRSLGLGGVRQQRVRQPVRQLAGHLRHDRARHRWRAHDPAAPVRPGSQREVLTSGQGPHRPRHARAGV